MAQGVKYLHDNKIAHRNLKPESILVAECKNTQNGAVDLIFKISGLSRLRDASLNNIQSIGVSTLPYMSPEVIKNDMQREILQDNLLAQDIWSLGILLHIFFYQVHPFGFDERK